AVTKHHAFWTTGRARGVLQKCERALVDNRFSPIVLRFVAEAARIYTTHPFQDFMLTTEGFNCGESRPCSQEHGWPSAFGDCQDALEVAIFARRVNRNRNHAGVKTAEKSGEIIQTRRVQD